jgi:hypothetical protein
VGKTHGVLHHFWTTGGGESNDLMWVDYFIDGEATPSISFQPAMMCGLMFPHLLAPATKEYAAGALCGKNSPSGGWFNTFPIPFYTSAVVRMRRTEKGCTGAYANVRGTVELPLVIPGSGISLGVATGLKPRLWLQKNALALHQPLRLELRQAELPRRRVEGCDGDHHQRWPKWRVQQHRNRGDDDQRCALLPSVNIVRRRRYQVRVIHLCTHRGRSRNLALYVCRKEEPQSLKKFCSFLFLAVNKRGDAARSSASSAMFAFEGFEDDEKPSAFDLGHGSSEGDELSVDEEEEDEEERRRRFGQSPRASVERSPARPALSI